LWCLMCPLPAPAEWLSRKKLTLDAGIRVPHSMTDSGMLRLLAGNTSYLTSVFTPKTKSLAFNDQLTSYPTVYLQPSPVSNPLRIDFPDWETDINGILSYLQYHCLGSGAYGYPLPLYVAHLESRIEDKHVKWTSQQVIKPAFRRHPDISEALLRDTRRNTRPKGL